MQEAIRKPVRGRWSRGPALRRHALALAALAGLQGFGTGAQAVVLVQGEHWLWPDPLPIGPGDTDLGLRNLFLGGSTSGSLSVDAGSLLALGSLGLAGGGTGSATAVIDGVGTRLLLQADGNSNRLDVGQWGWGSLTVSGGAVLDGRANAQACLLGAKWCHTFIGNAAGSTGVFTVTGSGSQASFLRSFVVGGLAVFRPPIETFTLGQPGGMTRGTVKVLDGAVLTTDTATLGTAPGGSSPLGSERSFAELVVDGSQSLWRVTGGTLETQQYASVGTATHRNAWATLTLSNGGQMRLEGDGARYTALGLTTGGGRSDMLISGSGSRLQFVGASGLLQVGRSLGSATLELRDGGQAEGMFYTSVGRSGSTGVLLVDGLGSRLLINGTATAAANGASAAAWMDIGREGGHGTVTVSNAGRIEMSATVGTSNGFGLWLGRDANSAGTLSIQSGGVVQLSAVSSAAGTAAETRNPGVVVGRDGSGLLQISGGGQLLLEGGAVSTPANRRSTNLYIGGYSDTAVGGRGIASVSDEGSLIRLTGGDSFIGVGIGAQSSGQLSLSNQATASAIGMAVGRSGGVGVLKMDNAALSFSGQQTAGNQSGAFLVIGSGGTGIGTAMLSNGSRVTLSNLGSSGAGLSLGGSASFAGGDGSLTLTGASSIEFVSQPGLNSLTVGREGTGFLRLRGGSRIDQVDGVTQVARDAGSDGTVILSEGSSLRTGWLGVGAHKTDSGDVDGGTGTFVLINSTLTAPTIVVGTNGFLGGTGTITGTVYNRGIFAPGNSPGTLVVAGDYVAEAGSRMILEVESDGQGGFVTDQVIFGAGSSVDLGSLQVEFRFLGQTDPNAFAAAGQFDVDTFLKRDDGQGGTAALADQSFAQVQFSAMAEAYVIRNFQYSVDQGASFQAVPVPEPATTALLLAGLATLGWRLCQRQRRG